MSELNEMRIRAAKPKEKPYKLRDGRGLHLLVKPSGARLWRFRSLNNVRAKFFDMRSRRVEPTAIQRLIFAVHWHRSLSAIIRQLQSLSASLSCCAQSTATQACPQQKRH
jgi:hypothetical protein